MTWACNARWTRVLGGLPGNEAQVTEVKTLATLPMGMGGLGFRSAERMAPSAFWASWADALPMMADRLPQVAAHVVGAVTNEEVPTDCLGELKDAAAQLDRAGFVLRPGWAALRDGARPLLFPAPNLASGNTGGSTMRLPLPNTIFGRPWCCHLRAQQIRLTCRHTQDQGPALSSWELQPTSSLD